MFSDKSVEPPDVTIHKACSLCPPAAASTSASSARSCFSTRPWSLAALTNSSSDHRHAVARLRVSLSHAMAEHMAELGYAAPSGSGSSSSGGDSRKSLAAGKTNVPTRQPPVQYHCSYCRFACTWKYDLELHLKQKHGVHKKL